MARYLNRPVVMRFVPAAVLIVIGLVLYFQVTRWAQSRRREQNPRHHDNGAVQLWWDAVPAEIRQARLDTGSDSNIHPADYAGPEACQKCHQDNYDSWSSHSHRWMNALANTDSVKGDFSGNAEISYLGGRGTFYRADGQYRMRLVRDDIHREYHLTQTIGSRFFQYYVGKQLEGPEPPDHPFYSQDHVMGFGYWLEEKQWIPVVHVVGEGSDGFRPDPYAVRPPEVPFFDHYASKCNACHTTFPLGDMLIRAPAIIGRHAPVRLHFSVPGYLADARQELWTPHKHPTQYSNMEYNSVIENFWGLDAPSYAVTLGISCEACHLGSRQHAAGKLKRPLFFPKSPHLYIETDKNKVDFGRSHTNVNWICGRCHAGERPSFAAGMATWNSTEYSDAIRGKCYSQLTCIECHDAHRTIGPKWSLTGEQDDALCVKCHQQYQGTEARRAHTHHSAEGEGSRCMNCHMPRINEGLQDVVRTHMIFSPSRSEMIEANHPNACNLCHVDRPIDWTLKYLRKWYRATFSEEAITASYSRSDRSVALGWLKSDNEAVRLVAADALTRNNARWALPELLDALDDPFILNRQFSLRGLERMLDIRLVDFGYQFYMMPDERREPLRKLRETLLPQKSQSN